MLNQAWTELLVSRMLGNTNTELSASAKCWAKDNRLNALLLTGGNDLSLSDATSPAPERDKTEEQLLDWLRK